MVQDRARAISVLSFGRKPEPELLGSCWWEVCALWFHLFGGASQLEPEGWGRGGQVGFLSQLYLIDYSGHGIG